jgi:polyketide synthase PksN
VSGPSRASADCRNVASVRPFTPSTAAYRGRSPRLTVSSCDYALAGGVNVLLDPRGFATLDQAGVLSSDGKIRMFSAGATGYVRGEGVGAVLLKSLSAAVADRDHIYAVLKASALNHDGRNYSLTAPNPGAQAEVMLRAYRQAAIDPGTVSDIEAQGTGSALGDPLEVAALKNAFRELYREWGTCNGEPVCGIGDLKPQIGHLECASGIAALIKLLLALQHEQLPAVKHVDRTVAATHLHHSPFYIIDANRPWPQAKAAGSAALTRRAGLNSFGFGGVNVHLVLEEYLGE